MTRERGGKPIGNPLDGRLVLRKDRGLDDRAHGPRSEECLDVRLRLISLVVDDIDLGRLSRHAKLSEEYGCEAEHHAPW